MLNRNSSHNHFRQVLFTGLAVIFAILLSGLTDRGAVFAARVYYWMNALLQGGAIAAACCGWGSLVLSRKNFKVLYGMESLLFSLAAGSGVVSLMVLLFGMGPGLNAGISCGIIGGGIGVGLINLRAFLQDNKKKTEGCSNTFNLNFCHFGVLSLTVILLIICFFASLTPPLLFDITEYHLGLWRDYQAAGNRFVPIAHNFYGRFPFPVESLYYLGLSAFQGGDSSPKMLNFIFVIAASLAGERFAFRLGASGFWRGLTFLAVLSHPVMLEVSLDAYIDAPVAFFVLMSVYGLFSLVDEKSGGWGEGSSNGRLTATVFFILGCALVTKYTVDQIYLLPLLILFSYYFVKRLGGRDRWVIMGAGLVALIPVVFWLGKNVWFYGNPLEPFFQSVFHRGDTGRIADEKFYIESHYPQSILSAKYWTSLPVRLGEYGWIYLAGIVAWIGAEGAGKRTAARIVIFCGVATLMWNLISVSQNRFLLPAIALVTAVAAAGISGMKSRWFQRGYAAVCLCFIVTQIFFHGYKIYSAEVLDYAVNYEPSEFRGSFKYATSRDLYYEKNLGNLGKVLTQINTRLHYRKKFLLVYEARPYLFKVPVEYNTVWDKSILPKLAAEAGSVEGLRARLKEMGYTHVLVNQEELRRYIQQYARAEQLKPFGLEPGEFMAPVIFERINPENYYPSFYRDKNWEAGGKVVGEFLRMCEKNAIIKEGDSFPIFVAEL